MRLQPNSTCCMQTITGQPRHAIPASVHMSSGFPISGGNFPNADFQGDQYLISSASTLYPAKFITLDSRPNPAQISTKSWSCHASKQKTAHMFTPFREPNCMPTCNPVGLVEIKVFHVQQQVDAHDEYLGLARVGCLLGFLGNMRGQLKSINSFKAKSGRRPNMYQTSQHLLPLTVAKHGTTGLEYV